MNTLTLTRFAANYDCNAYGAGTYNGSEACATTTGTQPSVVDTALSYTGEPIFLGIVGGVLLLAVAVASFVHASRKKRT